MSSGFRVLHLVRPFLSILPEVKAADRRVPFRERALYTTVALFVFLVCSQLPLYGIHTASGADPFYWARVIMASNRGTCMELVSARSSPPVWSCSSWRVPGSSRLTTP